jgi:Ca-activated chloride channel family protein
MMMTFIWPWMLIALVLVPLLVGAYVRLLRKRRQAVVDLGPLGVMHDGSGRGPSRRRHIPALLFAIGLTLNLFGLARPEMFVDLPRVEGTVILAFDVSSSMTADDLEPTRLEAAKAAARALVEHQPSTVRIGVVAFSNGGLVVQPPTDDQAAVFAAIDRLDPQGATSLAQGIYAALNAIAGEAIAIDAEALEEGGPIEIGSYPSAVVLLLTDGENTASTDPLEIAQLAAEAGVRIYPVGIGSPEGAVLQIDGYSILSRLDESLLQEIAGLTNGAYYRAGDRESLQEIYRNVDLQLTISGDKTEVTFLFAGLGLLFFLVGGATSLLWFGRMPL